MGNADNNIERIFKAALDGDNVLPSPRVLRNIKRNLFVSDFFSLNLRKFNVAYVTIILVAAILIPSYLNNGSESNIPADYLSINNPEADKQSNELIEKPIINKNSRSVEKSESLKLSAFYSANVTKGCAPLKIRFHNKSANAESYKWDFGNGQNSNTPNPVYTYTKPGKYSVKLISSNSKGSKAEYIQNVEVFAKPESNFEINAEKSDLGTKEILFSNRSESAIKYNWSFGDNTLSHVSEPNHKYSDFGSYNVTLVSISEKGCTDTITKTNNFIAKDYRLVFPIKFKPSLRGANKGLYERPENRPFVFYPQNNGASDFHLEIVAANGVEIFKSTNIKRGWDGYQRGRIAPAGTYYYKASGKYPNGKSFMLTGNFKLVVDNNYGTFNNN